MTTIRELEQKGVELKHRIEKFGAPLGNKNAAGPHDMSGNRSFPLNSLGKSLVTEKVVGKKKFKIILNGWNQGHVFAQGRSWRWVSFSGGNGKAVSKQDAINRLLAANKT